MIKKLVKFFAGLWFLCLYSTSYAQPTKPIQLKFSVTPTAKNQVLLSITANIEKEAKLINVQKNNAQLSSTLTFDSVIEKYKLDSLQLIGHAQTFIDTAINPLPIYYYTDSVICKQTFKIDTKDSFFIKGTFNYIVKIKDSYVTGEEKFSIPIQSINNLTNQQPNKSNSLLSIFIFSLLAGLLAVITPCVFPLVPVTVSFFLKRSASRSQGVRNAIWYSISIILIYTIPTLLLTLVFGDKVLYTISTHPVSNIFFFIVFIIFAISFLGAFDISLPNKWANKSDKAASKGGLFGIFFMALTLVIVSFSCTGPLVGTLLGQTATQGIALAPILGMLGFAFGLAVPFSLFALFPSMLKTLPKSGGWLNSVKVVFGFIELALAFKFLSNVDLAYHWRWLDREIFLIIWIIIFTLLGLYILGKLKFSHDSEVKHITIPRLFLSMFSLGFALYLMPGLWGAPLKSISGWLPPTNTQDFNLNDLQYKIENISTTTTNVGSTNTAVLPQKYINILHAPFGIKAYFDLNEAIAAAKVLHKPIMLDFTGHSCANCRKMENEVWSNPSVLQKLKNNFVIVSLYVDDQTILPEKEQYTNKNGEHITTLGEKNLDYEITKFGFNAQPLYMFLDIEGNILSDVKYGYDADVQKFINHLEAVEKQFYQHNK